MTFAFAQYRRFVAGLCLMMSFASSSLTASEGAEKDFNLPTDVAERSLKAFAAQSGLEVLYPSEAAVGVRTNAVRGRFTAAEAARRMLAGTSLEVVSERNGVMRITRSANAAKPEGDPQDTNGSTEATGQGNNAARRNAAMPGGPGTGTIMGQVISAKTRTFLANARIVIEGTALEAYSDNEGRYSIGQVPAGEATVRISMLGMGSQTAHLVVHPNSVARQDFILDLQSSRDVTAPVVEMETFVTVAEREMSAQMVALNEQRNAPNIKNVVAADEFGNLGEGNIGEFLKFVPGVAIEYSANFARGVSVRGFPSNQVLVMVDGAEIPSGGSGASRSLQLDPIQMTNIDRVEVTKVPTPDMPANALGGMVSGVGQNQPRRVDSKPATLSG